MNTIVIAGASGVVGSRTLHHLLSREDVDRVVALGRRTLPFTSDKLVSKIVDFQDAASLADAMPDDVAVAMATLGTTMKKAGSKEAFRAVDRDAVVAFAAAARQKGARHLLLVTSIGANAHSSNFYLRTKGEAEEAVGRLGFPRVTILRPSFIDDEGARAERRLGERVALPLSRAFFALVGRTSRYAPVTADVIARALVRLALVRLDASTEPLRVIESDRLHALGA